MTTLHKELLVPYSAEQMYDLVNDINKYSDFLPWCSLSQIIEQTEDSMTAKLGLSYSGFSQEFTTQNKLEPGCKIELNLVSGPFKHFSGIWKFTDIGESGCKVELDLDFSFSNPILAMTVGKFFESAATELVTNFYKRAQNIYGN